jgi:hypothetical protein
VKNGQNQLWINKLRSSTTLELDRSERQTGLLVRKHY